MGRFGNGVRCMGPGVKRLDQKLGRDIVAKRLPYQANIPSISDSCGF